MVTECAGGEDEQDCPYHGHCGQDMLTIDDKCYLYIRNKRGISWFGANAACYRYQTESRDFLCLCVSFTVITPLKRKKLETTYTYK